MITNSNSSPGHTPSSSRINHIHPSLLLIFFVLLYVIVSPLLESLIKSIKAGKGQLTQGEELESVGVSVQCHRFETGVKCNAEVKLYDLAGQVEYYGLHQLFLTERALYVLVWNASDFLGHKEASYLALSPPYMSATPASSFKPMLCITHTDLANAL